MRNDEVFSGFLAEPVAAWRDGLLDTLTATSVNSMVSAVNRYLGYIRRPGCRVKHLRVQRRVFRAPERDLTRDEYGRLLDAAPERLALIMETICSTGIRVSELRCITAEAVGAGRAEIRLKGKVRTILLPGKLCRQLRKYAKKQKIASGEIFLTRSGRPIPEAGMGGNEGGVQKSGGGPPQGVPSQPPAPVRTGFLPGDKGHRNAGGRAGALQRGHDEDIPHLHGGGARQGPRRAGACEI